MRTRSHSAQHDAAVARRLELLTAELAGVRGRGLDREDGVAPVRGPVPQGPAAIETPAEEPEPSVPRVPGRHASRRPSSGGGSRFELLTDSVRGQLALGPGQVAVVAVLVAGALALTCWWLVRGAGHEVAAPISLHTSAALIMPRPEATGIGATAGSAYTPAESPAGGSSPGGPSQVVVDVAGKVRRPGIAVLRQGARVIDALRAAGGARAGVDLGGLNLARVLTDGEQIVVGGPSPGAPLPAPSSGAAVPALVDINTADETALDTLPGVGPVTAQAILTWRDEHGGFSSVDQLLDVDGIGDATLAKLKPYVTV